MRILKRAYKGLTARARFEKVYTYLEDIGFELFMEYVAGENIDRKVERYRKNLNKVDSLYNKYGRTKSSSGWNTATFGQDI